MGTLKKGVSSPIHQLSQTYARSKDTVPKSTLELKYQTILRCTPVAITSSEGRNEVDNKVVFLTFNDYNQLAYEDFKLCLVRA